MSLFKSWLPCNLWRRFRFAWAHTARGHAATFTIAHHRTRAVCDCGADQVLV